MVAFLFQIIFDPTRDLIFIDLLGRQHHSILLDSLIQFLALIKIFILMAKDQDG